MDKLQRLLNFKLTVLANKKPALPSLLLMYDTLMKIIYPNQHALYLRPCKLDITRCGQNNKG